MSWNRRNPDLLKNLHVIFMIIIFLALPFIFNRALALEIVIFAIAAIAFDLLLGYTGIMMFCQASFFGSGAYITALLISYFQPNILLCMFSSMAGAAVLALLFGYLSTLRAGSYCVLLTLAFNEMVYFLAFQWKTLTGGSDGLRNIPRPHLQIPGIVDINLFSETRFYFFVLFIFILSFILIRRITESPLGKIMLAIRENEKRAEAIGYNTQLFKILAFVIGGAFMGLAGSLYCMFINFIDITSVHFDTSGKIVMMVLIGGMGTLFGPVLGAGIVSMVSDLAAAYWNRWPLILGSVFVAFVLFARGGIWGILQSSGKKFKTLMDMFASTKKS